MNIFDLPDGFSCSDDRWQDGYHDGCNEKIPTSDHAVYVSGWCHGFCGGTQCSSKDAEIAYCRATQGLPVEDWY